MVAGRDPRQLVLHREAQGSVRSYIVERSRRRLYNGTTRTARAGARGRSSPGTSCNLCCTVRRRVVSGPTL